MAKVERLLKRKRDEEAHIQLIKTQKALRESRSELAYIKFALDESTIVAITDDEGQLTYFNENFREISKYSREELNGKDHRIINSGYHTKEFFSELWETIRNGNIWKGEIKNRAKDGSYFWIETTIVPTLDEDRTPQKYIAISHDITESKEAEQLLQHSETYYRALIENSSDIISILNSDGKMLYQSPSVSRILGYAPDELIGNLTFEFLHPDDVEKAQAAVGRVLQNPDKMVEVEVRFRHKKGHWCHFACALNNLLDNVAIKGIVSNAFDITERKRTEAALRESEERYRILFDSNPLPMWVINAETLEFLAVNDAAIKHYGYSYEEFLSMTAADIRPPEDVPEFLRSISNSADKMYQAILWKHIKKDGTMIDVEITSHDLMFSGKRARLVLINDITEKKWELYLN